MGFPSHFFSSFHQGWFWQAVVHYIEAWKKWPGLCWWRILASKNNGKGKERLVCLDDCIGTSFFWWGDLHWTKSFLLGCVSIGRFQCNWWIYYNLLFFFAWLFSFAKISGNFFSNRRNKSPFLLDHIFFVVSRMFRVKRWWNVSQYTVERDTSW